MQYEKEYDIRISDMNPGNHVGHDRLLLIMHDARCYFFNSLPEIDKSFLNKDEFCLIETCLSGKNIGIVINELNVKYKSELYYPEKIKVKITVSELTNISMKMNYLITKSDSNTVVAEAYTKLVSFDYNKRKPHKFSDVFLKIISKYNS